MGDDCAGAVIIGREEASAGFAGTFDLTGASSSDSTCSGNSSWKNYADELFRIYLLGGESLTVQVTPSGSSDPTILFMTSSTSCDESCGDDHDCIDSAGSNRSETGMFTASESGWVTVKIDTYDDEEEAYTLNVSLTCAKNGCECQ
jgi:hypothetical protein